MCGRLNVIDDGFVVSLCEQLGVPLFDKDNRSFNRFVRATDKVQIIRELDGQRRKDEAIWWLLLEPSDQGFRASKYTSFNTRYDKLNTPRSAGYKAYRQSRCVIPVRGFGETQGRGKDALYTDFWSEDCALAMGGLYREWHNKQTGEYAMSCSIVTLPPHPKLEKYHKKSMPLILDQSDNSIDLWLDSHCTDAAVLDPLLRSYLPQTLVAQKIDKPSLFNNIGNPEYIDADY